LFLVYGFFLSISAPTIAIAMTITMTPTISDVIRSELLTEPVGEVETVGVAVVLVEAEATVMCVSAYEA